MKNINKKEYFILFLAGLIFTLSLFGLQNASFDILPEFQPKTIQVQTEALGLSASEVESLVTLNLEEMLTNTPWVENMKSISIDGLSEINLTFSPDTDLMEARQMVSEKLVLSSLKPNVSQQSIILQPRSTTNRVMVVGLSSKELSLIDISQLSRWIIRPILMSVPGVSNVSIWGNRERQLQVQVDQEKIKYTGVSLEDIIKDTGNAFWMSNLSFLEASTPGSGGWIDTPNQRLEIQHLLPIYTQEDLAQVPFSNLKYLTLGDVSDVTEGHQPLIGEAILDDGKGIMLVIEKYPESDVLSVTRGVEEKLAKLKGGLSDMEIDTSIFRPATFIESVLNNLGYTFLIISILILFGFFTIFYKKRIAFFTFFSIIMSLVITLFLLKLYGFTFNTILFAGVVASFGAIVDQVLNSSKKNFYYTISVSIISTLLVIPIFFLGDETTLFYKPLAISYGVSIILGLISALLVLPSINRVFSNESHSQIRDFLFIKQLKEVYSKILTKMIKKTSSLIWLAVVGILLIGSFIWLIFEESSMFPKYNEPTLIVNLENTPGTSLIEMNRIVTEISNTLQSVKGVSNFGATIGRAITGDKVVGIHSSQLWISINKEANFAETTKAITESLDKYPEIIKSIENYSQEVIDRHIEFQKENLFVRIYGIEFEKLKEQAEEVRKSISKIDGVINPKILDEVYTQASGIEIKINTEIANRYGLKPGDIRRTVSTFINGIEVANRFEEQKVYQVIVWSVPKDRKDIKDIKNLLIDTPNSGRVRLSDIADLNIVPIMNEIKRDKMSRYIDVVFESQGDKNYLIKNIKNTLSDIDFPLEYHGVVLWENPQNKSIFYFVIITIIIGILLLLQALFGSWRVSALIIFTIPASLSGGLLAGAIFGEGLSLGTFLGLLVVLSVAIQSKIRMIGYFQEFEKKESFGIELLVDRAKEHLLPALMTSFLMILIFVPILIMGGRAGFELLHPMSIVIIGGLITTNLVSLFFVPILYLWNHNKDKYEF